MGKYRKQAGGYIFIFKDDYENNNRIINLYKKDNNVVEVIL